MFLNVTILKKHSQTQWEICEDNSTKAVASENEKF
jgi:hypothetical protein